MSSSLLAAALLSGPAPARTDLPPPASRPGPQPAAVAWPQVRDARQAGPAAPSAPPTDRFDQLITLNFEAFAEAERRRRRLSGSLNVGLGFGLLAVGITTRSLSGQREIDIASIGVASLGGATVAAGVGTLIRSSQTERLLQSELFLEASEEGWTDARLDGLQVAVKAQAKVARRRRIAYGAALTGLGLGGLTSGSTLFAIELSQEAPDGIRTATFGQLMTASTGMLLRGITALAAPSAVEVIAERLAGLRR